MEDNKARAKALPPYTALVQMHNNLTTRHDALRHKWKAAIDHIRNIHNDKALSLEEKYALIVQLFLKTNDNDIIFKILGEMEEL